MSAVQPADERLRDTPPPDDAVYAAGAAADQVNVSMKGYDPEDWRDALLLLHRLRKVITTLLQVDANLVTWLYLHGEHGQHQVVDGIPGQVYIGRGRKKERWESAQAVRDYVDTKIEAVGGEYPDPAQVVEWVLEVLPAGTSTAVRKTPLRAAGLDVHDYYSSEPGTVRVDLPR